MQNPSRRYVFVEFEELKNIKFKKLERVCSKIYVLIDTKEQNVPLSLVKETQRLGKNLKWIAIQNYNLDKTSTYIAFIMGKLHEKVDKSIEFALLSNDASLDTLVSYINVEGRSCIRVKRTIEPHTDIDTSVEIEDVDITEPQPPASEEAKSRPYEAERSIEIVDLPMEEKKPKAKKNGSTKPNAANGIAVALKKELNGNAISTSTHINGNGQQETESNAIAGLEIALDPAEHTNTIVYNTARETVKRLIRSGNRPADISLLKSYILLHNQEFTHSGNVDKVIQRLKDTKEIQVNKQSVVYNF